MKSVADAHIGDTFYDSQSVMRKDIEPFPGYEPQQPMVYAGLYPVEATEYDDMLKALEKLAL